MCYKESRAGLFHLTMKLLYSRGELPWVCKVQGWGFLTFRKQKMPFKFDRTLESKNTCMPSIDNLRF